MPDDVLTLATAALLNGVADPYALTETELAGRRRGAAGAGRAARRAVRRRRRAGRGSCAAVRWWRSPRPSTAATLAGEGLSVTDDAAARGHHGLVRELAADDAHPASGLRLPLAQPRHRTGGAGRRRARRPRPGERRGLRPAGARPLPAPGPRDAGRDRARELRPHPDPAHGVRRVAARLGRMLRAVTRRRTTAAVLAAGLLLVPDASAHSVAGTYDYPLPEWLWLVAACGAVAADVRRRAAARAAAAARRGAARRPAPSTASRACVRVALPVGEALSVALMALDDPQLPARAATTRTAASARSTSGSSGGSASASWRRSPATSTPGSRRGA